MDNQELQLDNERYRKLTKMARLGWWEANFTNRSYICSEFVADLLGLKENTISFYDFAQLIREDFRVRISKEFMSIADLDVYEQRFPIDTKYGVVWIHSQLGVREIDKGGRVVALGFLQCIEDPEKANTGEAIVQKVNNLLYQQNSISQTLLSFLQTEDVKEIIPKLLKDILIQYNAGRAYIFEFDFEKQTQSCSFEVTRDNVSTEKNLLQDIPISSIPWWSGQVLSRHPIILYSISDLPPEAATDYEVLSSQNIKSLMVVPMVYKDSVWGYMGVDIVDTYRDWGNEDYQWLASLADIISICMGLRQSELKAQTERKSLQSLYKHMPVGYIRLQMLFDSEGNAVDYAFLDLNETAQNILGEAGANFLKNTAKDEGLNLTVNLPVLLEVLNTNTYKEINQKLGDEYDNKYCHFIIYSPKQDEIVIMFSDMTDTFNAHEALDRSEKILRNIYKNLPVGIELYDKDGYLIDMNDKDVEMFGLSNKESVLGVNIFENPNIPIEMKERIRNREDLDFTLKYDFSRVSRDNYYDCYKGDAIDLVTKVTCLYDSQGNFTNYLFINIDTTETTNAYSKIQEFENFFTLVGDYAKVGYAHFNAMTGDGYALSSWYKNVGEEEGTPLTQIIGIHSSFHPEDRTVMIDFLGKVIKGEATSLRREMRILRPNGRITWTSVNILVRDFRPEEGMIETVCINYDITNLKETEQELIVAKNKAETMDRLKSAFLANMSHEIRTPLNAIVGFSNLLIDTEDVAERKQYLGIVQENNDLLLQLISDILDLSKIEAGTFDFVKGNVDVHQLCTEIARSMSMKAVGTSVRVLFDETLPEYFVYSDKNRLMQVITNFINNALKFTPSGSITLGYYLEKGDLLKFFVKDTGVGIPKDKVDSIFERFVKLNSFVHGTGLGLSICKSIVAQIGGTIGVESELGVGSCFWFTHPYEALPLLKASKSQDASLVASPENSANNTTPIILIAEDTDSNYLLVSAILKKEYRLIRALNGKEAVQLFREVSPNLILMDMKMPEMDGIEATKLIREENRQVPILAVTAFAFDQDKQRTREAGCNDYISKPIAGAELKAKIKQWLNKSE